MVDGEQWSAPQCLLRVVQEEQRAAVWAVRRTGMCNMRRLNVVSMMGRSSPPGPPRSRCAVRSPCPCGYRNDPRRDCHCSPPQIERYMAKISGPLLDRIDLHIEVPAVPFKELSTSPPGTSSADMREHVAVARQIQRQRFDGAKTRYNAHMTTREIRKFCCLDDECMELLRASVNELGLSARAHDKVLRASRTIADLDQSEEIRPAHVQEAVNYRMLDRQLWT